MQQQLEKKLKKLKKMGLFVFVSCTTSYLTYYGYDTDQQGTATVFSPFSLAPLYIAVPPRPHTDTLPSGMVRHALKRERDRQIGRVWCYNRYRLLQQQQAATGFCCLLFFVYTTCLYSRQPFGQSGLGQNPQRHGHRQHSESDVLRERRPLRSLAAIGVARLFEAPPHVGELAVDLRLAAVALSLRRSCKLTASTPTASSIRRNLVGTGKRHRDSRPEGRQAEPGEYQRYRDDRAEVFPRLRGRANATRARGGSADPPGAKASARGNLPGSGSAAERGSTTSRPLHQPSASFFARVFFQHLNISPFFRIKPAFARN